MMAEKLCNWFFIFIIFSFAGWLMETLLYAVKRKQAVKRGFLYGPVCPIYGTAAVFCDILLYQRVSNIFLVFVIGFFLSGVLEYLTHFVMEKMFHAMWWDYSGRRLNLHGRIYLNGLLYFGAGVVLIVKLLLPMVHKLMDMLPLNAMYIGCFIVYSFFLVDFVTTISELRGTIKTFESIQASVVEEAQKGIDLTAEQIESVKKAILESSSYRKMVIENPLLLRFRNRYPDMTLTKYKYIFDLIVNTSDKEKERKDIKLYGTAETAPHKDKNQEEAE